MNQQRRQRAVCEECGSTSFSQDPSGHPICRDCGTLRQGFIDIAEEFEDYGNVNSRGGRRHIINIPKNKHSQREQEEQENIYENALYDSQLVLRTFQILLRHQCVELIRKCHLPSQLFDIVGRLWLSFLSWWKRQGWGKDNRYLIVQLNGPGLRLSEYDKEINKQREQIFQEQNTQSTQQQLSSINETILSQDYNNNHDDNKENDNDDINSLRRSSRKRSLNNMRLDESGRIWGDWDLFHFASSSRMHKKAKTTTNLHQDASKQQNNYFPFEREMQLIPESSQLNDINEKRNLTRHQKRLNKNKELGQQPYHVSRQLALQPGVLSMNISLCLLYLAIQLLRIPISMQSLINLAKSGRIPYQSIIKRELLPPRLYSALYVRPRLVRFFTPHIFSSSQLLLYFCNIISANTIEYHLQSIHTTMLTHSINSVSRSSGRPYNEDVLNRVYNITTFPLLKELFNIELYTYQFLIQLNLPLNLLPPVLELIKCVKLLKLFQSKHSTERNQDNDNENLSFSQIEEIHVLSCIVITLLLLFGLNDQPMESNQNSNNNEQVDDELNSDNLQNEFEQRTNSFLNYLSSVMSLPRNLTNSSLSGSCFAIPHFPSSLSKSRLINSEYQQEWLSFVAENVLSEYIQTSEQRQLYRSLPQVSTQSSRLSQQLSSFDLFLNHLKKTAEKAQNQQKVKETQTTLNTSFMSRSESLDCQVCSPLSTLSPYRRVCVYASSRIQQRGYFHHEYYIILKTISSIICIQPEKLNNFIRRIIIKLNQLTLSRNQQDNNNKSKKQAIRATQITRAKMKNKTKIKTTQQQKDVNDQTISNHTIPQTL